MVVDSKRLKNNYLNLGAQGQLKRKGTAKQESWTAWRKQAGEELQVWRKKIKSNGQVQGERKERV